MGLEVGANAYAYLASFNSLSASIRPRDDPRPRHLRITEFNFRTEYALCWLNGGTRDERRKNDGGSAREGDLGPGAR